MAIKTWNGLARASLKTFNGLASASLKTINGVDATASSIAIQNNWKNHSNSTAALSVTVAPTAGRALVIAVATNAVSFTVTDNQSGTYSYTPTYAIFGSLLGYAYIGSVASGVTSVTITPATTTDVSAFVFEVSNISTYTTGEYATNFFVGVTTWSSGSFSTATANSIVFHAVSSGTGNGSTTFGSYTNGHASYGANSTHPDGASSVAANVSYEIVSATGSQQSNTVSSASGNGGSLIAAFR